MVRVKEMITPPLKLSATINTLIPLGYNKFIAYYVGTHEHAEARLTADSILLKYYKARKLKRRE